MNHEIAIIDLNGPVLGWAVGAGWLDYILMFPKKGVGQSAGAGQLPALVGANRSAQLVAKTCEDFIKEVEQRFFCLGKEAPDIASSLINRGVGERRTHHRKEPPGRSSYLAKISPRRTPT
jgi:hypothetical protein